VLDPRGNRWNEIGFPVVEPHIAEVVGHDDVVEALALISEDCQRILGGKRGNVRGDELVRNVSPLFDSRYFSKLFDQLRVRSIKGFPSFIVESMVRKYSLGMT